MADERTRPLYVVPDTNYLLHGRPLDELTPQLLGLQGPITAWVLVRTVAEELDKQKYVSNRLRKRAANVLQYLDDGEGEPRLAAGAPVRVTSPETPIPYAERGFDPTSMDDKICAEIKNFESTEPGAEIVLLTLDDTMRRFRARLHQIVFIKASIADPLRVVEEPDPQERELAALRLEKTKREAAAPKLKLSFAEGAKDLEIPTFPILNDEILDAILDRACASDAAIYRNLPASFSADLGVKNEYYDLQLGYYRDQLREVVPGLWTFMGLAKALALTLANDGAMQANDVAVYITLPPCVSFVDEPDEAPELPRKPDPHVPPDPGIFATEMRLIRTPFSGFDISTLTPTRPVLRSHSGPDLQADGSVRYWRQSMPQHRPVPLAKLNIELEEVPSGVKIDYEISAENIVGLHSGHILLRPIVMDTEAAIDKVCQEIMFGMEALKKKRR